MASDVSLANTSWLSILKSRNFVFSQTSIARHNWSDPDERLKILVVTPEYPPVGGGGASVCRDVAQGLTDRGHEVHVLTMGFSGCADYERIEGVNVFRTQTRRTRSDRCTVIELAKFVVGALKTLRRHPQLARVSICHAHFIVPAGVVAWCLKRRGGLPYIITGHGSDVLGYNRRFRFIYPFIGRLWRRIVCEAEAVTVASPRLAARIAATKVGVDPAIIPNPVDVRRFEPMAKERRILIVSRLISSKGTSDVLEAIRTLDLRAWRVDIVGDGPLYGRLRRQVWKNGLSANVIFHGWISNESRRMRELYGRAFLFVSASYLENMSVAHLEALSAGCRIITSAAPDSTKWPPNVLFFTAGDIGTLRHLTARTLASYGSQTTPRQWVSPNVLDTYARLLAKHAQIDGR